MDKIINKIAEELKIKPEQVENTVKLIDDGNTIPFIARYRKEVTGGLSDEILRDLGERLSYLRNLETRKEEVIKSIDEQGKLTDELTISIASAETLAEVEDLYRPFKQKKKTRATVARAKGLEPLSDIILAQEEKENIYEIAKKYINIDTLSDEDKKNKDKVVSTAEDAIQGALDIIAENIANVNTTSTGSSEPYRRKIVTFSEKNVTPFSQIYSTSKNAATGNGVKVSKVTEDYTTEFTKEYDPSNPDADADGYVSYPNVNTVTEMTNLIDSTRAYEANATAFDASKAMAEKGLQIGK